MGQNSGTSSVDEFFSHCADMLFIAERSGAILRSSRALTQALSPDLLDAAPREGIAPLIHPEDRPCFDMAWRRLGAEADTETIDLRLKTADGSFKPFRCTARWVPEKQEVYGTLHDATEHVEHQMKLGLLQAINDHLPVCLWAIDERGVFVHQDGKACATAGVRPGQFLGLNIFDIYPPEGTGGVRQALAGEANRFVNEMDGVHWDAWYLPVRNERGKVVYVVGVSLDITPAKVVEQELRAKLELVEKQQHVIRALSTPIIQVWDRVITLPIVGTFDSARAADVMDSVLREISRTRARYAILDLTGIEAMDTSTAHHLLKLSQAIKLLGAEGIITGIHPAIAQTIIGLGVDLASIVTRSTLREGLRHCIQSMSREGK